MRGSSLRLKIPRAGAVSDQLEELVAQRHELSCVFRPNIDLGGYSIDARHEGLALLDVGARVYHGLEQPPGCSDDRMSVTFRPDGELELQASEISRRCGGKGLHVLFLSSAIESCSSY